MCGIAGHFAWGGAAPPVDRDALLRTRDHMAVRGPDGKGVWVDASGRVGLAHRRLSILDPTEAGAQPMALDGARLVVTFNGEVYNFRELRRELEAAGRRFRTASDTEVLLHLYDRDGPGMVGRLRGMFALAIWDAARRGLFLARDGFGIKPLYYADTRGTLRFASQVKALLAGGGIDTSPSAAGRAGFFVWGYVPEPWTFFEHIRCLPAGCTLWVDGRGARPLVRHFDIAAELADARERAAACGRVPSSDGAGTGGPVAAGPDAADRRRDCLYLFPQLFGAPGGVQTVNGDTLRAMTRVCPSARHRVLLYQDREVPGPAAAGADRDRFAPCPDREAPGPAATGADRDRVRFVPCGRPGGASRFRFAGAFAAR